MNWKQYVRETAQYHYDHYQPQKKTAEQLKLSQKQIHMILEIYAELNDPEIQIASGIEPAYKILLKRKNEKKNQILNQLTREE